MNTAGYDVAPVRAQFPALVGGSAHFDGPGGSQTPTPVALAIHETLTKPLSYRGRLTPAERNADDAVTGGRQALADLLGVEPEGIVFGRSMTAHTFDLARTLAKDWGPGDEIVVTRLDHDANVRPWVIAAERAGASVRFAEFDPASGELAPERFAEVVGPATKLVAVTAASNLIGTMPDLPAIADLTHAVGARLFVDGVHYTAHELVDVPALGADFFACSPYKFLGPHCGVLYGRPEILQTLQPDKLLPSTDDVPERFELGTLPYELMAGAAAAVDFLAALVPGTGTRRERLAASMGALSAYEDGIRERIEAELRELPGAEVRSRASRRTPTLFTTFEGHDPGRISAFLAERGVAAPAGTFYAYEANRVLGLGPEGGLRIGVAPYTDESDVDRLLSALREYFAG